MSSIRTLKTELGFPADVWFLDIWGVLHNGVRPYAGAVSACTAFRKGGGKVILVSNSPRPREGVARQLDSVGVPREAYDAILTSGDVSRALIARHKGEAVFHLGPERDLPVYDGTGVTLTEASQAKAVVCTGLFDDETETPENYRVLLDDFRAHDLDMICVNPDIKVERGARIIYCAGALAEAYEGIGGRVHYAGKPYAPIYEAAFALSSELAGRAVSKDRILAIGDGVKTDIAGALQAGIAAVYVASAVHVKSGETVADAASRLFPDACETPARGDERVGVAGICDPGYVVQPSFWRPKANCLRKEFLASPFSRSQARVPPIRLIAAQISSWPMVPMSPRSNLCEAPASTKQAPSALTM